MFKKIVYLIFLIFLFNSCAGTFDSVKRGLTGAKKQSAEEFLVEKKDPLILPPDYDSLPMPGHDGTAEVYSLEKTLRKGVSSSEDISPSTSSTERSILEKIRKD